MSNELNLGIVGCGYWGPNLIRNFRSIKGMKVRYVCDRDQQRRDHMKSLYSDVEATADLGKMIGNGAVDAVVIATPVSTHHRLAKQCLEAGKHVFVEKPMATSSAECRELVELARKNKLTLMVGHTFVYSAPVRKIKQIIDAGDLGEVLYISSQRLNLGLFQKDINVAWDLAPHDISIVLYLLQKRPESVNCQGKSHVNPGIEDVTNMSLNYPNGGFATIHSSWLDPNKIRRMTIVGSRRMVLYDDTEPLEKIKVFDKRVETPPHYDTFGEFQFSYHYGDMYSPYVQQTEPLKVECQHFHDCIATGARSESSGEAGLAVVKILEAASKSLKEDGNRVKIDLND